MGEHMSFGNGRIMLMSQAASAHRRNKAPLTNVKMISKQLSYGGRMIALRETPHFSCCGWRVMAWSLVGFSLC